MMGKHDVMRLSRSSTFSRVRFLFISSRHSGLDPHSHHFHWQAFQKKFEKEKRRLQAQFVAEKAYAENVGEYVLMVTFSKTSDRTLEDLMISLAKRMMHITL
jgi:hypothetical protein